MALEQPKKPSGGAFGRFMAEKRPDFIKQCPGKPVGVVMKLASEKWKAISAADKAPYQKAFEVAQEKYAKDLAAFVDAGGIKTKGVMAQRAEKRKEKAGGKIKVAKDLNRPKKPAGGAFGCFLEANRAAFMKDCAGQAVTAVTKLASAKWKVVSETEKAKYEKAYQEKKTIYEKAMQSYVPPAGAEADEGEEEEGDDTPSPPAKKAKTAKAGAEADTNIINAKVGAEAKQGNLTAKLNTLLERPEIKAKKLGASVVLKALQDAGGKVVEAKRALISTAGG